jgi:hypothetical protein
MAYGPLTKCVDRSKLADAVGTFGKISKPTTSFANSFLEWAHYQTSAVTVAPAPALTIA